jgi:hypothetical protein
MKSGRNFDLSRSLVVGATAPLAEKENTRGKPRFAFFNHAFTDLPATNICLQRRHQEGGDGR